MHNLKQNLQSYQLTLHSEDSKHASEFAKYVDLTSQLIERSYMQTFKLLENWELHKIIRRYNEAKSKTGKEAQQKYWWYKRREDKLKNV